MFDVASVRLAPTNKDALKILATDTFDCIFVDNMMSVKDGLDLTRHIRRSEDQKVRKTAIILCTAYTGLQSVIQARDAGVTEVLAKPVSPEQIIDKLSNALFSQRNFIDTDDFTGPDRRRRIREAFSTNGRRQSDTAPTTDEPDKNDNVTNEDQQRE